LLLNNVVFNWNVVSPECCYKCSVNDDPLEDITDHAATPEKARSHARAWVHARRGRRRAHQAAEPHHLRHVELRRCHLRCGPQLTLHMDLRRQTQSCHRGGQLLRAFFGGAWKHEKRTEVSRHTPVCSPFTVLPYRTVLFRVQAETCSAALARVPTAELGTILYGTK